MRLRLPIHPWPELATWGVLVVASVVLVVGLGASAAHPAPTPKVVLMGPSLELSGRASSENARGSAAVLRRDGEPVQLLQFYQDHETCLAAIKRFNEAHTGDDTYASCHTTHTLRSA